MCEINYPNGKVYLLDKSFPYETGYKTRFWGFYRAYISVDLKDLKYLSFRGLLQGRPKATSLIAGRWEGATGNMETRHDVVTSFLEAVRSGLYGSLVFFVLGIGGHLI